MLVTGLASAPWVQHSAVCLRRAGQVSSPTVEEPFQGHRRTHTASPSSAWPAFTLATGRCPSAGGTGRGNEVTLAEGLGGAWSPQQGGPASAEAPPAVWGKRSLAVGGRPRTSGTLPTEMGACWLLCWGPWVRHIPPLPVGPVRPHSGSLFWGTGGGGWSEVPGFRHRDGAWQGSESE